ncbi:restriction endonuclease subunit S [Leptospira interrogans]|uniref:restriction endonuclease subunit S n=1 Tax=Leptospira interrogans TaxID=173 RepID=UPI001EEE6EDA|nr:restriction endonuclease subunit S [Leptospira interrogans]
MGDILTIQKGKKHSIAHDITTSLTRLLQIEDLRNDNQLKYTNDTNGVLATEEDLMIVWDGANAGTVGYGKRGFIGSTISVLKKKDQNSFDTRFLGKFLQSQFSMLRKKTSGTTIPHIDRSILENIFIPVLNLSDQIHIAHILSQAEALIAQRKESIRLLDELVKSKFLEMFGDPVKNEKGWEVKKIDEIAEVRIGPFGSLLHAKDYIENGIPLINPSHMIDGNVVVDCSQTITVDKFQMLSAYHLKLNDIVVARRGEIGRCAIVKSNKKQLCGTGSMFLRVKNDYVPLLLQYQIYNTSIKELLVSKSKGVTMKNLNSTTLGETFVINPPINIQNQFVKFIKSTEVQRELYEKSLHQYELLYASLSQKAFNGELTANQKSSSKVSTPRITPETSLHVIATDSNKERTTLQKVDKAKSTLISKKEEQSFLKRKILGSYIINQSLEDSQFGDVKFEKLLHLSEYLILKRNFGQHYIQKVAGPYDNKFTILFFQQIEKDRWFRRIKEGKQFHFQKGEKHESSTKTYNYFSEEELGFVQSLIQLFKKANYEKVEVVSTLYAVWNNRIIKGEPIEDNLLKEDFLNWDPKKEKYQNRLDNAIVWMREKNLVPDGWGPLIEKTK